VVAIRLRSHVRPDNPPQSRTARQCLGSGRELNLARTSDGRSRAKARGVRFGRPAALDAQQRAEAIQRLAEGATQADLARSYGVSQATISRLSPGPFASAGVAAM
jgi:hypothetical protein